MAGLAILLVAVVGAVWLLTGDTAAPGDPEDPPVVARLEEPEAEAPTFAGQTPPTERQPERIDVARPELGPEPVSAPIVARPGAPAGAIAGHALDRSGQPVSDVAIAVYLGDALLAGAFPGARQLVEVQTISADDGSFVVEPVPVGSPYILVGEHDEFARSETGNVRVEDGKTTSGVVLRMDEGSVVRGTVSAAGGSPIAGARVEFYDTLQTAFQKPEDARPWKVVFTDAAGRYAFTHVSSSSFRVRASADLYETQTRTSSHALDFTPKDEVLDFELRPGQALPGRVVDVNGVGLQGARVEANSQMQNNRDVQSSAIAYSDEGGWFVLEGLGGDRYTLMATAEGYSDKKMPNVTVTAGQIQVMMERRGSVEGWVSSTEGQPITSYSLHLMRSRPNVEPHYLNDGRSFQDDEGWFLFDNVDPGEYVLEVRAGGFADTRSDPFTIERQEQPSAQLRLVMSRGGTLKGIVIDADGQPVKGARVSLNPNNFIDSSISRIFKQLAPSDERERRAVTDGEGRFVFGTVPPGTYQVRAEHPESAPRVINDVVVLDDRQGGNRPIEVALPRGAVIAGQAVDDMGPLAFCKVQINRQDSGFMDAGTTDKDGYFRFRNLAQGEYQVTINPERVNNEPVHPFVRLVYAKKSMKTVYVNEGQVIDGMLIHLTKE
jgi:protocatechuate 3,4-dioxygenase beta subunit